MFQSSDTYLGTFYVSLFIAYCGVFKILIVVPSPISPTYFYKNFIDELSRNIFLFIIYAMPSTNIICILNVLKK